MPDDHEERLTLADVEEDFKKELADADAWYADLHEKEIGWIRDGQNPETEFDKLYANEPLVDSPTRNYSNATAAFWHITFILAAFGGGLLFIAGFLGTGAFVIWREITRTSRNK
jgi:hypothetical protein